VHGVEAMQAEVERRMRRGGLASLRARVHEAPAQQPQRGLLVGRQVAGVDGVLDVGEPLPRLVQAQRALRHPRTGAAPSVNHSAPTRFIKRTERRRER